VLELPGVQRQGVFVEVFPRSKNTLSARIYGTRRLHRNDDDQFPEYEMEPWVRYERIVDLPPIVDATTV
jgi:hypothetical protein